MTAEQRSLLGWAAAVAILASLFAAGSLATILRAEGQDPANDPRFAQLRQQYKLKGDSTDRMQTVLARSNALIKQTAPLQTATLVPYAAASLLLGAAALWARRDQSRARYVVPLAALVIGLRLVRSAVELHVATLTTKMMSDSIAAGLALGSQGKPMPRWFDTSMAVFGSLMTSEMYMSTVAWAVALAGFYGFVAAKFWRYSPASLRPL